MAGEISRGSRGCDPNSAIAREIERQTVDRRQQTIKFTYAIWQPVNRSIPIIEKLPGIGWESLQKPH